MKQLSYNGTPMRWEPSNWPGNTLLNALDAECACSVVLEPGDATRYDLIIVPLGGEHVHIAGCDSKYLLVTRVGSKRDFTTALLSPWNLSIVARELAQGWDWTEVLLTWWLDALREKLYGEDEA